MRFFGSHNRNKGLLTENRDITQYRRGREDETARLRVRLAEVEMDMNSPYNRIDFWLLCHPDNEISMAMFDKMLEFAEETSPEVSHDTAVSWLATAIRCQPANLVPRGEGITIREKVTIPSDPRGSEWNTCVGVTQTCLLMQFLSKCSVEKLSVDERANIMFALLRILVDSDEVSNSPHAESLFVRLHPAETRVDTIEALAAIFFQISNDIATMADAIRLIWRLTYDEPLVMRLTVEILMCLCQRAEIAATLPDFRMGDQMYCNQVKVIILDLTSDAHVNVPELHQKDELSTLVNEVFNLRRRDE